MKILLDTNILVHAYNRSSVHRVRAAEIVKMAMRGEIEACLSAQVLYEFFAVVTSAKRVEHPMSLQVAADLCMDLWECREIEKLNPSSQSPLQVFKLVKELKLSNGGVFDCVLAVTAKENAVEAIFTENVADFKHYSFVKATNPLV